MSGDIGKNSCWCGICYYMLNCPENCNHEKCNLNLAFEAFCGELKLDVEEPSEPCCSCYHASWQLIYELGICYYGCDMSHCYLADDEY